MIQIRDGIRIASVAGLLIVTVGFYQVANRQSLLPKASQGFPSYSRHETGNRESPSSNFRSSQGRPQFTSGGTWHGSHLSAW